MELQIRELTHVTTLEFATNGGDTAQLLRLLADYLDHSGGTLLSVTYHNSDDGTYREWIVAAVECAYETLESVACRV